MARKKAGIGELIQNDMSRRNIGANVVPLEFPDEPAREEEVASGAEKVAGIASAEKAPEKIRPVSKARKLPGKIAPLLDYIALEVESEGGMDEQEQQNFYDFMLSQATRYVRGFNAGKRFHQG
jgi:hypothetical protein